MNPSNRDHFEELAREFNMVSVDQDMDVQYEKINFHKDGNYRPRIYFLDKFGHPLYDVVSTHHRHRYYYVNFSEFIDRMKTVLLRHQENFDDSLFLAHEIHEL